MKRTHLVLDEERLEEARKLLGAKTYSETVNRAIEEIIRIQKIRSIPQFFGKISWQGDLAEMRQDHPRRVARRRGPS